MAYANKTIKDIPNWLECPFCWEYRTKLRVNLEKHYKKCEELDFLNVHADDAESEYLDEETTTGDYIQQQLNAIELTKKFIKSNELDAIKTQSPTEIRQYIKNKLIESILKQNIDVDFEVNNIYEFFFGETEESKNFYEERMINAVLKRL